MFELRFCRTDITALQTYLRDSGAFRREAVRQITNKTNVHITTPRVSLNSAEYGMSAKLLPLRITTTSNSHGLFLAALYHSSERGGHTNANALCGLADHPSGGRNCPRVPLTILHPNCSVTSSNYASTRSLVGVHASASIACTTGHRVPKAVSPHSSGRMPYCRQIC